ncbi:NAD(P)/FAD-dependent oxidoreductase [Paraburkholderia silviterrae]|uniref:NAD(P)/FAD-dependent oxidoreductase n=1 Tax=Paraburkholderia silviterrae TaxID=2528715 RepID=A0A4R5M1X2_9BURK|nr:NAD(P)/FAD-dependent oxidoreductase [Paraburkholderia silviterrae]TDG19384.1 NAD(P)/FAD-dependent oxidoreductase [Paraburkholderia silviterrae]
MRKIVILGAGYAGLRAMKELHKEAGLQITLINRDLYHYEATELHTVAAGTKAPADIIFDLESSIPEGVDFRSGTVNKIDVETQCVYLEDENIPIAYDYLIVALGFESEDFGIKGAAQYALPLANLADAFAIRTHLEQRLARFNDSRDENDLSIVVCGAGITGIELVGELVYRMPEWVAQHKLPADKIRITCLDAMPAILPMFDAELSRYAIAHLADRGVSFQTSSAIDEVTATGVRSGERVFPAHTIIWTTGVRGSHVVANSGFAQKRNRVAVEPSLSLKGHPEVFFIGDVSAVADPGSGHVYPTTAQISVAQATHAALNLKAQIAGKPMTDFTFKSRGTVCSLGPLLGIAQIGADGSMKLEGRKVAAIKKLINDTEILEVSSIGNMISHAD